MIRSMSLVLKASSSGFGSATRGLMLRFQLGLIAEAIRVAIVAARVGVDEGLLAGGIGKQRAAELGRVAQPIAVAIAEQRIAAASKLLAIAQPIAVAVGVVQLSMELTLFQVDHTVAVDVDRFLVVGIIALQEPIAVVVELGSTMIPWAVSHSIL